MQIAWQDVRYSEHGDLQSAERREKSGVRGYRNSSFADCRAALGTMIVRQGLLLVLLGTLIGAATAFGVTRYPQRPTDPDTFLCACITLVTVTVLACYSPARPAIRVEPMVALRYE